MRGEEEDIPYPTGFELCRWTNKETKSDYLYLFNDPPILSLLPLLVSEVPLFLPSVCLSRMESCFYFGENREHKQPRKQPRKQPKKRGLGTQVCCCICQHPKTHKHVVKNGACPNSHSDWLMRHLEMGSGRP